MTAVLPESELIAIPGARWQCLKGQHTGSVVIIERETAGKVYFRREKGGQVGMSSKKRQHEGPFKLDRTVFYRLYQPYGARDLAGASGQPIMLLPPAPPLPDPATVMRTEDWLSRENTLADMRVELAQRERERAEAPKAEVVVRRITPQPAEPTPADTKECRRCHVVKPHAEFNRSTASKDGRQAYCRACDREYNRIRHLRKGTPDVLSTTDPAIIEERLRKPAILNPAQTASDLTAAADFVKATQPAYVQHQPEPAATAPNGHAGLGTKWRVRLRRVVVVEEDVTVEAATILDALAHVDGNGAQVVGIQIADAT